MWLHSWLMVLVAPSSFQIYLSVTVLDHFSKVSNDASRKQNEDSEDVSLIKCVEGWKISETDSEIIKMGNEFCKKLQRKLKNTNSFKKDEFLKLLNSFLEKSRKSFHLFEEIDPSLSNYTLLMIQKLKFFITPNVAALILEACVAFQIWDLVDMLIVEGVVGRFSSSNLIESLIEKKKSNLLCLCIMHFSDIQSSDVRALLKYFLSPPRGAHSSMAKMRKKWEKQALMSIEKATDGSLPSENLSLAKQASLLLMIAHDDFSSAELCMHYLFASSEIDDLTLSYSLSGLDGSNKLKLIRYFGKWVKKYLRFPQAGPCPKAADVLGLKLCRWVPSLESVVKYLGLVLDEQFASLVLDTVVHDELRSLEEDVKSLASEARFCSSLAILAESLKVEIGLH
ncbi:hypothetical protein FRX31_006935 [Thalictrum thalictroides]|uniref:Uncharacterized protein n=1 Tax=Thalictrum thalictroides TaxID=46969 RepID=A0A7J6X3U8_THATH|nr:hypothetical protein FRX31_006935 [Thalictrum thalictroides]